MRNLAFVLVLTLATFLAAGARQIGGHDSQVSRILVQMGSENQPIRKAAFREMLNLVLQGKSPGEVSLYPEALSGFFSKNHDEADRVRTGFVHLLATENAVIHSGPQINSTRTEDDSEYYAQVIAVVSSLNDEQAIPALMGAITSGGMATRGLARFGDKTLGPVLDQLQNQDPMTRSASLFTVRNMLKMRTLTSPSSHDRVRSAIRSSLEDPESVVRSSAISALEYLDSREEFVLALKVLAEHDPAKLPGSADDGGELYPVRLKARRLLNKIANHDQPATANDREHE